MLESSIASNLLLLLTEGGRHPNVIDQTLADAWVDGQTDVWKAGIVPRTSSGMMSKTEVELREIIPSISFVIQLWKRVPGTSPWS